MNESDHGTTEWAAEEIFDEAVALAVKERIAFLDRVCGVDSELRRRVEDLLAAHEEESGFLPGDDSIETMADEASALEGEGTLIGRYKLLEKLGEGGFGSVWAAEQREPVKRRVALKIVKLGMDTKQVVARFEAERQALALMDHPNIAKVLDAGTTETGRPYFVMELVKGIPITKFFEVEGTSVSTKLKLFIRVCQAIQHAHQKGIIHRDIKPSNVMLTLHDGEPVPKVIDFGIAKATQGELTDKTIYTQYSQFIGTPAYMSPEQAEMSGLDIDTRSDVYSLGVLLYELLTGATPFDTKELMASGVDEMRKIIRERDPVRPSTRVSETMTANGRSASGLRLESIAHDLDWIVMKCLEKDRSRRYETANGLAMDLQRYLANEPILARPPSLKYRVQKAYRRNRYLVGGSAVVAVMLVLGVIVASYSWKREKAARLDADDARRGAESLAEFADRAREDADRYAREAKQNVYAADMNLAALALADNNLGKARRILAPYREDPKFEGELEWEWRYLWNQVNSTDEIDWSEHHNNAITAVSFLEDSSRVVSGSYDGSVKIWDHTNGEIETLMELEFGEIRTLAASSNGRYVGAVYRDSSRSTKSPFGLKLVDSVAGTVLAELKSAGSGNQHRSLGFLANGSRILNRQRELGWNLFDWRSQEAEFLSNVQRGPLAISEDERIVVIGSSRRGRFEVFHLEEKRGGLEVESGRRFDALAVSSTSGLVASGHFDPPVIRIFDARSGDSVRELMGHTAWVSSLEFSSDGRWLYSGAADQSVCIWDVESGELLKRYRGHTDEVWSLALSQDGALLASGGKDGSVRLWPGIPSLGRDPILRYLAEVDSPAFARAPEGEAALIAGIDRTDQTLVRLFEVGTKGKLKSRAIQSPAGPVLQVALGWEDRLWLLTETDQEDSRHLLEIDLKSEELVHRAVVVAGEGKSIGFARGGYFGKLSLTHLEVEGKGYASLFQWTGGTPELQPWPDYGEGGSYLLCASAALPLRNPVFLTGSGNVIVPSENGATPRAFRAHGQAIMGFSFSPDGKRLFTGGLDGYARCWDLETLEPVGNSMRSHLTAVHSLGLSPDGRRLVTGSVDGQVAIWDAQLQRELGVVDLSHLFRRVLHLTFLTNDILLVGGQDVRPSPGALKIVWHVCRAPIENSNAKPEIGFRNEWE